jgi:hypothetical protein
MWDKMSPQEQVEILFAALENMDDDLTFGKLLENTYS